MFHGIFTLIFALCHRSSIFLILAIAQYFFFASPLSCDATARIILPPSGLKLLQIATINGIKVPLHNPVITHNGLKETGDPCTADSGLSR